MVIVTCFVLNIEMKSRNRGVACLRLYVGNCGDLVNTRMQKKKTKKGAFTNSLDPDEIPQDAASHQALRYLPCLA